MRKLYISVALAFMAGLAAGAAGTWTFANKKAREDFDAKLDSVRKKYKELGSVTENVLDISEETPDEKADSEESYVEIAKNYSDPVDYTSYTQVESEEMVPTEEDTTKEESDILHNDPTRPRVISEDDYYYEEEMTKLEICLFETDGDPILTDDAWDPLDEPYKVITKEDLDAFVKQDEEDEIYTLCEARNCMYSISKQGLTWEEFLKANPIIIETRY